MVTSGSLPKNALVLPSFSVTPRQMFSNTLPLLDVDFFSPMENVEGETTYEIEDVQKVEETKSNFAEFLKNEIEWKETGDVVEQTFDEEPYKAVAELWGENFDKRYIIGQGIVYAGEENVDQFTLNESEKNLYAHLWERKDYQDMDEYAYGLYIGLNYVDKKIYKIERSSEEMGLVISTEYVATNIDEDTIDDIIVLEEVFIQRSTARELQATVSKWYQILRDIAIVALLSILVYIGIRILLSSVSSDKAKYKQMLVDWLIALCLLFVMQYLMTFLNVLNDKIIDIVCSIKINSKTTDTNADSYDSLPVDGKIFGILRISKNESDDSEEYGKRDTYALQNAYELLIENWVSENGSDKTEAPMYGLFEFEKLEDGSDGDPISFNFPMNDEMTLTRVNMQLLYKDGETWVSIGYKLIYVVLVVFTVIFLFTYLRRVLYMAFLTMIAPLVAMTYPIDKINDGNAQAFNAWFKEYIFNLLIQPMHLVIYTVLIGSAMDLATSNIIYVACALGFMIPAEKLMRKFFGFEKAQTPGMLAGAAGAGLMMAGMNKLFSKGPKGGKDASGKGGDSDSEKENLDVRTKEAFDTDEAMGNGQSLREQNVQQEEQGGYGGEAQQEDINALAEGAQQQGLNALADGAQQQGLNAQGEGNQQGGRNRARQNSDRSFMKGLERSARFYARGMKKKMINKGKNMHIGRKIGGLALGATAGTIGLVAGIASGDPSKALQYTGAGALGGYKLGEGAAKSLKDTFSVKGTGEVFKENYYGEKEYRDKQIQKAIKQKQDDIELQWKLEDDLNSAEAARFFMEVELPNIMKYGDFDNNTLSAMAQMRNQGFSTNEAVAAALISERDLAGKDYNASSAKARKEFEDTIRRRGSDRGLSGDNLNDFTRKHIDAVKALDKIRFKV